MITIIGLKHLAINTEFQWLEAVTVVVPRFRLLVLLNWPIGVTSFTRQLIGPVRTRKRDEGDRHLFHYANLYRKVEFLKPIKSIRRTRHLIIEVDTVVEVLAVPAVWKKIYCSWTLLLTIQIKRPL
jgi:hypothetical protein